MTVRISKPPIDLRSKLSELERPTGLKGNELLRAETAQDAREVLSAGRKNMIINGAMAIDQRNEGSSFDLTDSQHTYVLDRFTVRETTSTSYRVQRNTLSSDLDPPGFRHAMKISTLGNDQSVATGDYSRFQYFVEAQDLKCDWGIHNTDYLTLSFWVKSSATGRYFVNLEDGDADPIYLKPYDISQADTWQKIEVTYPPPTSGDWTTSTANDKGMRITWVLSCGTNYQTTAVDQWRSAYYMADSAQVNFAGATGNAFWITGVQLERGRNATEFEHRSYGEELALCQRYYGKIKMSQQEWLYNESNTSSHKWHWTNIPFSMRANPSIDVSDLSTGISVSGLSGTISSISAQTPGDTPGRVSTRITMTQNTGTARYVYHFDGWQNEYMALSAEL